MFLLAMLGDMSVSFPRSSPLKMARELLSSEKQGIGEILYSDCGRFRLAPFLRRTLSADMPSAELSISVHCSSSGDETRGEFDVWEEMEEKKAKKPGKLQIWSSILSQKVDDESRSVPPYTHPLVKASSSSLGEKSLKICTESLGSETGSDGFSSCPASETGDAEDEKKASTEIEAESFPGEQWMPLKYNYRKPLSRSFPPPISSLSHREGDSIRMQSRRVNGRLVLEAVSDPSENTFLAKRREGRLVLSFICSDELQRELENNNEDELEEAFADSEEDDEEEEEDDDDDEEIETVKEPPLKFSPGFLNIHRLARSMNRSSGFSDKNGVPSNKAKETAEQPWTNAAAQSLPPRPKVSRRAPSAASLNDYEYPWMSNSDGNKDSSLIEHQAPPTKVASCRRQKERSLLFREPQCIATS